MSTTLPNQTSQLPDSVPTGGPGAWRLSDGKIQRGRQEEPEVRGPILGYLRRITAHYGELDNGDRYGKLECELETRTGREVVGASLLNAQTGKPTLSSCISLAEGLLEVAAGELCQIEAVAGKKPNKFGRLSTYARVTRIDPIRFTPIKAERRERSGNFDEDYLDTLLDQLREHPAYAERPARDNGPTHRSELDRELSLKGWPTTTQAPDEWLAAACKAQNAKYKTLGDVPDDAWGEARQQMQGRSELPGFLKAAAEKLAATGADEPDPFA